jgi:3-oxoacyl-[acyl-carrier protein] reductase
MNGQRELAGRVALVTGAGRNIGRSMAMELAAGGAAVIINVRSNLAQGESVAKEIEATGGKAMAVAADVADAAAVDRMVATAIERFGRLDYLVNNAAVRGEQKLEAMSYADWRRVLDSILDGTFHCVKAALPHLKKSRGGAIVNIGGLSGHTGAKDRLHVVTAKSGLVGMTRALAYEFADAEVTVNLVVPGLVGTPRSKEPHHHGLHHTLFGKPGQTEDIAGIVRFLCGPAARYINGQTIHLSGGAYFG